MTKTILLTGATDGIGLEAAKLLAADGHHLLIHGRSEGKLSRVADDLRAIDGAGPIKTYIADLADMSAVAKMADHITEAHQHLDVLINNAGVFKTAHTRTGDGYDIRFAVNTLAPYLLTRRLMPIIPQAGRVINLSSAAQASVNLSALMGASPLSHGDAYAQSKLAITMWSAALAGDLGADGPVVVAVNPASLLGSKMVKEAYGMAGKDLSIGAEILFRAALSDEFAYATGKYFDNDSGRFAPPHRDAQDMDKCKALMRELDQIISAI